MVGIPSLLYNNWSGAATLTSSSVTVASGRLILAFTSMVAGSTGQSVGAGTLSSSNGLTWTKVAEADQVGSTGRRGVRTACWVAVSDGSSCTVTSTRGTNVVNHLLALVSVADGSPNITNVGTYGSASSGDIQATLPVAPDWANSVTMGFGTATDTDDMGDSGEVTLFQGDFGGGTSNFTRLAYEAPPLDPVNGDRVRWFGNGTLTSSGFILEIPTGSVAYSLSLDAAGYSLAGSAVDLRSARRLVADAGAYGLSGQDVTFGWGRRLATDGGAYAVAGSSIDLARGYRISADAAGYSLNGPAASFRVALSMPMQPGTFALTGTAVGFKRGYRLAAAGSTYALTGAVAGVRRAARMTAAPATYTLTGSTASMRLAWRISLNAGAYSLAGGAADLIVQRPVTVPPERQLFLRGSSIGRLVAIGADGTRSVRLSGGLSGRRIQLREE